MGRASMLALPVLAVLGVGGWWFVGRESHSTPTSLLDEAPPTAEEENPSDIADLKAGPRAVTVASATVANSPHRIEGVVLDEKGKAVADVTVRAHTYGKIKDPDDIASWGDPKADDAVRKEFAGIDDPKAFDGSNDPTAKSDKDGKFAMSVPEAGNYEVAALPAAGRVSTKAWANSTKDKPVVRVTVRLLAGVALTGQVVDADGKGIASFVSGSWIVAGTDNPWLNTVEVPSTATDPSGAFTFVSIPDGKGTLTVKVAGRGTFTGFSVTTPTKEALVLKIGASGVIKGRVTDATGQGIAGADISLTTSAAKPPPAGSPRGSTVRGKTQPDGTYRLEGVVAGLVKRAVAAATGYTSLTQAPPAAKWTGVEAKDGVEANLDLVMLRGGTVVGRVLDKSDKASEVPVANAEVFLLGPTGSQMGGQFGGMMQTTPRVMPVDKDGGFKFEDVPLGKYTLYARSPSHYLPVDGAGNQSFQNGRVMRMGGQGGGGSPVTTTLVLTKEGETFEKNLLMLKGLPVSGIVKGPDGAPVEGAKIRSTTDGFLQNSWQYGVQAQGPMTLATSGQDGRFQIPGLAPNDNTILTASKPPLAGKPSKGFKVKADTPTPEVELVLEKGATVSGKVIDADGNPIVGANVQCYSQDGQGGNATETTGADGAFKLEGLPPGKYHLWCWSNSGGNAQKSLDPALTSGEVREGIELKMVVQKKGAKLSGTLVDDEGNGIAQSQISAQGSGGSNAWAQTDQDGAFTFNGLAEGKVTISVQVMSAEGGYYQQEAITNATFDAPGEGVKVVVAKKTTITIAGRVLTPDGTPVPLCVLATKASAGAKSGGSSTVSSFEGMVYTGGPNAGGEVVNGEFRREVQLKAPFDLVISSARDAEGRPLNLKTSTTKITESNTNLEIKLEGGLEIRGKVLAADGTPVVGAWVSATNTNDRTVEDGSFKLVGLDGEEVSITVSPTEKYTAPAKPTKAKPGATDVVIRLEAGLSIVGRILDPQGAPVTSAYIQVIGGGSGGRNHFGAQVDPQGAFKVENLPKDGTYDVTVQVWNSGGGKAPSYKPWSKSGVKPGPEELIVRLEGGESIEGVVVDTDGKPVSGCWVNAQGGGGRASPQGANTDEQGKFTCGGLDVGVTYVLKAQQWNGTQRTSLPVRAEAGARDVKIVFPTTVKLTGRLTGDGEKTNFNIVARATGPINPDADTTLANGQTMADGTFSIEVPADTVLDLFASKWNDDRFGFVAGARAGGGDVSIRIEVGKTIEGSAEDADGNPLSQNTWLVAANDAWSGYGTIDATGKWKIRGLPPGRYHIKLMNNSGGSKTPVTVDADTGATGVRIRSSS